MAATLWFSPFTNQNVTGIGLPIFSCAVVWKSLEIQRVSFQ